MNPLIQFASAHQVLSTFVAMAFLRAIVEMWPSPTKDSSKGYVIWFQFVNSFFGSIIRAFRSQVENSPNFQDAVKKFIVENPDVVQQHLNSVKEQQQ